MQQDDRNEARHDIPPVALEARAPAKDGRLYSPSAARNKDVIRQTLLSVIDDGARVLEIASGTGEHGAHVVQGTTKTTWLYSDIDPESLASQRAWSSQPLCERLLGPVTFDITRAPPQEVRDKGPYDVLFAANLLHIAPFEVSESLLAQAPTLLAPQGVVFLYGPFARDGDLAPSNARFDADLKRRDARWGVRDLDRELQPIARQHGLLHAQTVEMPANNCCVVFRRQA